MEGKGCPHVTGPYGIESSWFVAEEAPSFSANDLVSFPDGGENHCVAFKGVVPKKGLFLMMKILNVNPGNLKFYYIYFNHPDESYRWANMDEVIGVANGWNFIDIHVKKRVQLGAPYSKCVKDNDGKINMFGDPYTRDKCRHTCTVKSMKTTCQGSVTAAYRSFLRINDGREGMFNASVLNKTEKCLSTVLMNDEILTESPPGCDFLHPCHKTTCGHKISYSQLYNNGKVVVVDLIMANLAKPNLKTKNFNNFLLNINAFYLIQQAILNTSHKVYLCKKIQ